MKKTIYILLLIIVAFINKSCVIESYEKPNNNYIGYSACSNATEQLFTLTATVDQLRILDQWYTAENQTEKDQIENDYFPKNKIRLLDNDTISLSGYYNVYTGGKTLLNNTWVIKTSYYLIDQRNVIYNVQQFDNKNYTIERQNKGDDCKIFQTVEVVNPDEAYIVTNQSANIPLGVFDYYDYLSFTTVQPVTLARLYNSTTPWWSTCINAVSGEVKINAFVSGTKYRSEAIEASFTDDCTFVTFRGIEKKYINPCLDNFRLN